MGERWGECEEGEIQGAPMTGFLFRMAIHPYVRELDGALAEKSEKIGPFGKMMDIPWGHHMWYFQHKLSEGDLPLTMGEVKNRSLPVGGSSP